MNLKILTIVMPIYNIEDYLMPSLESFISNDLDLDCLEILMVDDGSTDSCPEICKRYADMYPNSFKYLRKSNGHYGSAVNYGIDYATGVYLKIVDGDDRINPIALNAFCSYLNSNQDLDMVLSDYVIEYPCSGKTIIRTMSLPAYCPFIFGEYTFNSPNMHSIAFKTILLQENGIRLDSGVMFTDVECSLFPIPFVRKVSYVPELVYIYMMEREGQSVDPKRFMKIFGDRKKVLNQLLHWYENLNTNDVVMRYVERRLGDFANTDLDRCLRARGPLSERKKIARELDCTISQYPSVYQCFDSKPALILKRTGYRGFTLLSLLKKISS